MDLSARFHKGISTVVLAIAAFFSDAVQAEIYQASDTMDSDLPRLEVGVAAGYFSVPDFPGAAESRVHVLALPYAYYRGEVLRSDQEGVRGRFFRKAALELDMSFGGAFPANSEENRSRREMPNLDWLGEFGPRLQVHFYKQPLTRVTLAVPVRYVFSTDFTTYHSQGFVLDPDISWESRDFGDHKSQVAIGAGPTWGSEKLNDYFYEVAPRYARKDRPVYDARSGYMGTQVYITADRRFSRQLTVFVGAVKHYYAGVKNHRSPLLGATETESYILGLTWAFYTSDAGVN